MSCLDVGAARRFGQVVDHRCSLTILLKFLLFSKQNLREGTFETNRNSTFMGLIDSLA